MGGEKIGKVLSEAKIHQTDLCNFPCIVSSHIHSYLHGVVFANISQLTLLQYAVNYHKSGVDLLQYLLLYEDHVLALPLLNALLFQLLAGVHLSRGSHLTSTHLPKAALTKHSVLAERLVRYTLSATKQLHGHKIRQYINSIYKHNS